MKHISQAITVCVIAVIGLLQNAYALPAPPAKEKARVLVQQIQKTNDMRRLLVPVKVDTRVRSTVTAEVEGFVTKIRKNLGDPVKASEVILYVENKDPTFTYAAVPVRSPVAGILSQLNPTLMTKVVRGEKLFSVTNPQQLKLCAEIPAADLEVIRPGTKGSFKGVYGDKGDLAISVAGISPLVDSHTGTASAELLFEKNTKPSALPAIGSVGNVLFEISQGEILLVPESALTYVEGKPVLKILSKTGLVQNKIVELGGQKESLLVIKSGLEVGDNVILRSNRSVNEGEEVSVESDKPAAGKI